MKHIFPLFFILSLFFGMQLSSYSQDEQVRKKYTLTHHMSEEEKALFHTVGEGYEATEPPPGEIHNIAEYEKMEGVLVGYPGAFGISYELIASMSQQVPVTTVVENNGQLNYVTSQYENNGVNMDNTVFIVTPLDSYWTRDYGPWYIRYGDDQIGIIDFIYNRPNRPNDNAIPPQMADHLGIEWFGMEFITAGGNYMTDGYGISSSSDLCWVENPDLTAGEIDEMLLDYCGIQTYLVLPDPNNTYIDHIDCWGKFLDVDKVLIREVPETHPQYDEIEETADYYANEVSMWGNNFQVYRVWTPNNEPYTNSLILNNTVYLPIMGGQWDDEAIAAYEEAMPGYEILPFTGSWESTDALHCRTKGVADRNTLYIEHFPLLGEQPVQDEYFIEAEITAYSGEPVIHEEVMMIYWVVGNSTQEEIVMTHIGGKIYSAVIPSASIGEDIAYFIIADDEGGNIANHPFIGESDPHIFRIGETNITLGVNEIVTSTSQGNIAQEEFQIINSGDFELTYEIEYSDAMYEDYNFDVEDSPTQNAWSSNTYDELGWTDLVVDNAEGEIANWSVTFDWDVDQYVDESTFYVESPSGTITIIAAGLPDGNYTLNTGAFNGELMEGNWKLWLTDGYGDGGHQASNIIVTITKTYVIAPWLTVEPLSGTIQAGDSQAIDVECDASVLPVGDYEGIIMVSSNDPDFSTIEVPVYFTVELESNLTHLDKFGISLSNFPNPFTEKTTFEIELAENQQVKIIIYNGNGQFIKSLVDKELQAGKTQIEWNGKNTSEKEIPSGVYFYRIETESFQKSGKLILY